MHTCIHAYMHTCIHAYMHTCIHAYRHTRIHAYMNTCINAYMNTCIHAYMHTCIHAYMHTCIHSYIHTCIHAYTRDTIFGVIIDEQICMTSKVWIYISWQCGTSGINLMGKHVAKAKLSPNIPQKLGETDLRGVFYGANVLWCQNQWTKIHDTQL